MHIHVYKPSFRNYLVAAFHSPVSNETEIRQWCHDTFGKDGYDFNTQEVRWRDNIHFGEVSFGRESDLAMFLLKWT